MTSNLTGLCKRAFVVLLLSMGAFALLSPNPASAGEKTVLGQWDVVEPDGTEHTITIYEEDGEYYEHHIYWDADGEFTYVKRIPSGNPNLEGGATGLAPSRDGVHAMVEGLGGLATDADKDMMKTPLGDILIGNGGSIVPVWNPGEIWFEAEESFGGGHGGGFDPNGGPVSEQLGKLKNGGGNSNPDGSGDDARKQDHGFYDGDYAASPELVNPPKADG